MSQANQPRSRSGTSTSGSKGIAVLDRPKAWVLSPSDFAFLWDESPRCFYKKVVLKQGRPRTPFPKVFSMIDRAMKDFYVGERAEELAEGAPAGVIGSPDRWVKSAPLLIPGCTSQLVIRGRLDALVACDDDTACVIDFKTAERPMGIIWTPTRASFTHTRWLWRIHLQVMSQTYVVWACCASHPMSTRQRIDERLCWATSLI